MSRSEKRTPIIKYGGFGSVFAKRQASKKARKSDIGNGSEYKKVYDRYNIFDNTANLYRLHGYNKWEHRPMTIEEINEYWRK